VNLAILECRTYGLERGLQVLEREPRLFEMGGPDDFALGVDRSLVNQAVVNLPAVMRNSTRVASASVAALVRKIDEPDPVNLGRVGRRGLAL
jgi:hypothetical protein